MALNAWIRKPNCGSAISGDNQLSSTSGVVMESNENDNHVNSICGPIDSDIPQEYYGGDVTSLEELMSEELAKELQHEENLRAGFTPERSTQDDYSTNQSDAVDQLANQSAADQSDVSSDWLMAQMLQKQFDQEHDKQIQRYEKVMNRNNKVCISYDQFKLSPGRYDSSDSGDSSDEEAEEKWEEYFKAEGRATGQASQFTPKRGFVRTSDGTAVTKHDADLSGRRNVSRMENFGPSFQSGDGTGMDLKLSNKVYKSLKTHSYRQENRAAKLHEKKDHSTAENAMDAKTSLLLMKMVNNGVLDSIGGCASTGKEANIYHAFGGPGNERLTQVPEEVALKVHKSTLNEFKARDQYIADDYRFKKHYSKQNSRKIVEQWTLKEFLNLEKMHRNGIRCPKAVKVKKNIVIMEFLGKEGFPAPNLKEASLTTNELQSAFDQSVQCIKDVYRKCKLVHADLSEYNLLWLDSKLYVIDVSQSVDISHPKAHQFLFRDCRNITSFFSKHLGESQVPKVYELFNMITGQKLDSGEDLDLLAQIEAFESNQELLTYQMTRVNFPFDYLYDKTALRFTWTASDLSSEPFQAA